MEVISKILHVGNKKVPVALWLIGLLVALLAFDQWSIFDLKQSRVSHIWIFGRVIDLPNSYLLDTTDKSKGISFRSAKGYVVIEDGVSPQFLSSMDNLHASEEKTCGVTVRRYSADGGKCGQGVRGKPD